jgi:hypothetical protein
LALAALAEPLLLHIRPASGIDPDRHFVGDGPGVAVFLVVHFKFYRAVQAF